MRSTPVLTALRRALEAPEAPSAGATVVVGLSGGADSVSLLHALADQARARKLRLVAAHLDHGLRRNSAEDAAFCESVATRFGIPCVAERADVRATRRRRRGGLEDAARAERLAFLSRVADAEGASTVALAHTRDDQAETLLLRLMRGAAGSGLAGMAVRRGRIWRPLLDVSRDEVREHARRHGLPWRDDPSNDDLSLARNRVRHELIPYLERHFNAALREVLARSARVLGDEAGLIDREARVLFERSARRDGAGWTLTGSLLREAEPALARAALRRTLAECGGLHEVSSRHLDTLLAGVRAHASSARPVALPGGRQGLFRFGDLWVGPRTSGPSAFDLPLEVPGRVRLPDGRLLEATPAPGPARAEAEQAVIPLPSGELAVRTRRPGDRVRRRGQVVSLRRFLMERRIPADVRPGLPVVAAGARVLWVPGQPIDTDEDAARTDFVRLALTRVS